MRTGRVSKTGFPTTSASSPSGRFRSKSTTFLGSSTNSLTCSSYYISGGPEKVVFYPIAKFISPKRALKVDKVSIAPKMTKFSPQSSPKLLLLTPPDRSVAVFEARERWKDEVWTKLMLLVKERGLNADENRPQSPPVPQYVVVKSRSRVKFSDHFVFDLTLRE